MNQKKLIIFDLDGTLYRLKGGSFKNSDLQKKIMENAIGYIQDRLLKNRREAMALMSDIKLKYGENISIGLEKEFGFDRYDYFDYVWRVEPKAFMEKFENLEDVLMRLSNNYQFLLTSDAPMVWIKNVLRELGIEPFFNGRILSGEGNKRKIFGNRFKSIIEEYKLRPDQIVTIGDQEETDIIPAKLLGMKTIFINKRHRSDIADLNIKDLRFLEASLNYVFGGFSTNKMLDEAFRYLRIKDPLTVLIMQGSSQATAFRYRKWVYKVGRSAEMLNEVSIYREFQNRMKENYVTVFPDLKIIFDRKGVILFRVRLVGECNLENYLLSPNFISEDNFLSINEAILANIDLLYQCCKDGGELENKKFFKELVAAIKKNISLAGIVSENDMTLFGELESNEDFFVANSESSLSHKDLSAGNILVCPKRKKVFFIDPKKSLSYLKESFSIGNVGIDLVGYYVTILRKELEHARVVQGFSLPKTKKEIEKRIERFVEIGAVNERIVDIYFLYWYSVYLACSCAYCNSPEKQWLYEDMAKGYARYSKKLICTLKNEVRK